MRPPFLHASLGQNRGGGLCAGSWHFCMTTITGRRMPRGRAISAFSLAVWWLKLEKNHKVRKAITQIASVLTVTTVFVGFLTLIATFYGLRRRGAYTWDKNTCVGTFTKSAGGLMRRGGGRICGTLRYYGSYMHFFLNMPVTWMTLQ